MVGHALGRLTICSRHADQYALVEGRCTGAHSKSLHDTCLRLQPRRIQCKPRRQYASRRLSRIRQSLRNHFNKGPTIRNNVSLATGASVDFLCPYQPSQVRGSERHRTHTRVRDNVGLSAGALSDDCWVFELIKPKVSHTDSRTIIGHDVCFSPCTFHNICRDECMRLLSSAIGERTIGDNVCLAASPLDNI